jgi:hypothetical protein
VSANAEDAVGLTGLLIGAGFSYELGMPLVWGLTEELLELVTDDRLWSLREEWHQQGVVVPASVIDDLVSVLKGAGLHYEQIIGYLESQQYRRARESALEQEAQAYALLRRWLVEVVYWLFWRRHTRNAFWLGPALRYYEGLSGLAERYRPLWVFSLNHDMMVECLATAHHMRLVTGFTGRTSLVWRDPDSGLPRDSDAELITGNELRRSGWRFLGPGEQGVNLMKIHGGLEIFVMDEGRDLVRLVQMCWPAFGPVRLLQAGIEQLSGISSEVPGATEATRRLICEDDRGQRHTLDRSLVAGAHKLDEQLTGAHAQSLLESFRNEITGLSSLLCIGYSFGDDHIKNERGVQLPNRLERQVCVLTPRETGQSISAASDSSHGMVKKNRPSRKIESGLPPNAGRDPPGYAGSTIKPVWIEVNGSFPSSRTMNESSSRNPPHGPKNIGMSTETTMEASTTSMLLGPKNGGSNSCTPTLWTTP